MLFDDPEPGRPRFEDTKFQGNRETLAGIHAEAMFHECRSFLELYGGEMKKEARQIALEVTNQFYDSLLKRGGADRVRPVPSSVPVTVQVAEVEKNLPKKKSTKSQITLDQL